MSTREKSALKMEFQVKYASCSTTRRCLERMIDDLTGIQEEKASKKKEKANPERSEDHRQIYLFTVS